MEDSLSLNNLRNMETLELFMFLPISCGSKTSFSRLGQRTKQSEAKENQHLNLPLLKQEKLCIPPYFVYWVFLLTLVAKKPQSNLSDVELGNGS